MVNDPADPAAAAGSGVLSRARRTELDDAVLRYRRMWEIRLVEQEVFRLFASGKIHGSTHLAEGQEALAVALASVTRPDDMVSATYRSHAVALACGVPPVEIFAEVMGRADGNTGGVGGSMHLCDMSVGLLPTFAIVGAGLPVAAGCALAFQILEQRRISIAVFGDGSTNIGAFHESMNLAAVWHLPVLFVIDHNMYGEYSRWDITTPIEDLRARATSYDMESVTIDGMDIDAARAGLASAVDFVRSESKPMLVEAKTYRFSGHSRSDMGEYRPPGEMDRWRRRDPIVLGRDALLTTGLANPADIEAMGSELQVEIEQAVAAAEAMEPTPVSAMFRHVWAQRLGASGGGA